MNTVRLFGVLIAVCAGTVGLAQAATPEVVVKEGMDVALTYTLTVDGAVVDSTQEEPFHYVHGRQQIIPGLEKSLKGLKVGDQRDLVITPEEAYGQVNPTLVMEITKDSLPPGVTVAPGVVFRYADDQGRPIRATIKEVKDTTVVLDGNHPLAGKTLNFHIAVVGIQPAVDS